MFMKIITSRSEDDPYIYFGYMWVICEVCNTRKLVLRSWPFFEGFCQCETDDFSSVDFCDRKIFGGDIMVMWVVCRHCWTRQLAFYPLPGFCYNCGGDLLPVRCGKFIILCA